MIKLKDLITEGKITSDVDRAAKKHGIKFKKKVKTKSGHKIELSSAGSQLKIHTNRGVIEIKGHKKLSQFVNILRKNFRIV